MKTNLRSLFFLSAAAIFFGGCATSPTPIDPGSLVERTFAAENDPLAPKFALFDLRMLPADYTYSINAVSVAPDTSFAIAQATAAQIKTWLAEKSYTQREWTDPADIRIYFTARQAAAEKRKYSGKIHCTFTAPEKSAPRKISIERFSTVGASAGQATHELTYALSPELLKWLKAELDATKFTLTAKELSIAYPDGTLPQEIDARQAAVAKRLLATDGVRSCKPIEAKSIGNKRSMRVVYDRARLPYGILKLAKEAEKSGRGVEKMIKYVE